MGGNWRICGAEGEVFYFSKIVENLCLNVMRMIDLKGRNNERKDNL